MENPPIPSAEKSSFEKERGRRPRILITNDDGPQEGVEKLAERLSSIADVVVVVPEKNNSEISYAKTPGKKEFQLMRRPKFEKGNYTYHTCPGTPVEAVLIADAAAKRDGKAFDACVSGPNDGWNIGDNLYPSGTFSAASMFKQLNRGKFAAALSLAKQNKEVFYDTKHTSAEKPTLEWDTAAEIGLQIVNTFVASPKGEPSQKKLTENNIVLNFNVPNVPLSDLHPEIKWTTLGDRKFYAEKMEDRIAQKSSKPAANRGFRNRPWIAKILETWEKISLPSIPPNQSTAENGGESFKIGTKTHPDSLENPKVQDGIMEDVAALYRGYVTCTPVEMYRASAEVLADYQNQTIVRSPSTGRFKTELPVPKKGDDRTPPVTR